MDKEKRKTYLKKYRRKHRKQILINQRDYYYRHREEILSSQKDWREKNSKKAKMSVKNYREKRIKEIKDLIGDRCIICDSKNYICFHEIHGKKHNYSFAKKMNYILAHLEDFVPMCVRCHSVIHRFSRLKKTEKAFKFVQFLKRG